MESERLPRRLAAILYADVAGYSRLTGEDEDATHLALVESLDLVSAHIESHRGRVMHYAGDAVLARFDAAVDALSAAVAVQSELESRDGGVPDERRVRFRIGVNLGDVIEDRGEIYGDGVNVAARLEGLADAGGVCVSESVRGAVGPKLGLEFQFMGEQAVKNIAEPVRAYRVIDEAPAESPSIDNASANPSSKPSVAVLPFTNMSGEPEQEYFSDGITEDITAALSNVGWFLVAARHSAFAYRGKAIDVRKVGMELGVQYVLGGSVRKRGTRLRITAELIETASGKQVWANRYDGAMDDVFDLQDQITETIVGTLEPEFQRVEAERIGQKRPENLEAYDCLLRGQAHMNKATPEDTRTALHYFYEAIAKDPGYGRAYAFAFWCYRRTVDMRGLVLSETEEAEARRLIQAGLRLNDEDHVVLWQAGTMQSLFDRDFEGALALIDQALAINPNSPRPWYSSAMARSCMGDTETAIAHAEHSIRISPRNPARWYPWWCIAAAHLQDLRYEKSLQAAKNALQLNDGIILAHLILAASCAHLGRHEEARAEIQRSLALDPKLTVSRVCEIFPIARYKNLDAFIAGLEQAGLAA